MNDGGVTFASDPDGVAFATFDGSDNAFLRVDESTGAFSATDYTLSFWFRLSTENQVDFSGLFASDDGTANGDYQVDFRNGDLRINYKNTAGATAAHVIETIAGLGTDTWHLVTITGDTFWFNDSAAIPLSKPSLGALESFALGANRNRDRTFVGDIADTRIYGSATTWSDAIQSAVYQSGPGSVTSQQSEGTLIMISSAGDWLPTAPQAN